MKYSVLFFLSACCLTLAGCSQMPSQATGPQGGGEPLPLGEHEETPRHVLPQRPMGRRRRNALLGRSVAPSDNAACGGSCGCGACDYPLWLYEAQRQEGLYLGYDKNMARASAGRGEAVSVPLKFSRFAAEAAQTLPPAFRSALFIDYCFSRTVNPKTERGFERLGQNAAPAENWLHYGAPAKPCFGALMVAEEEGQYELAFCVGALTLPRLSAPAGGAAREEIIYLGLGVKRAMPAAAAQDENSRAAGQVGLVAFAAAAIAGFRLPQNYRPCKEHFKLEHSFWAEQFRAQIAQRQSRRQMEQSGEEKIAAAAPQQAAAALRQTEAQQNARKESRQPAGALEHDWPAQIFPVPPMRGTGGNKDKAPAAMRRL